MGKKEQIEAAAAIIKEALAAIDRAKAMIVEGTDAKMIDYAPERVERPLPWEGKYRVWVQQNLDSIAKAAGLEVETHPAIESSVFRVLNVGELTLFEIE